MGNPLTDRRRLIAGAAGLALLAPSAFAQSTRKATGSRIVDEPDAELDVMAAWVDRYGRPTVKVMLNGQGPYDFLVDTGSNTTVVAQRHIEALGIPYTGMVEVNGTTGVRDFPLAEIRELIAGSATRERLTVAVGTDVNLLREDGILGADVFAGRRLTFNIPGKTVTVESPARNRWRRSRPNLTIRNGNLAEIDGRIGKVGAKFMLDTGSDECIINGPLRDRLSEEYPRLPHLENATVRGVTGHVIVGDYLELPDVRLGNVIIRDAGAVVADVPIFRIWDLEEEPSMIVGVNVLSRLDRFSIDYGARIFEAVPMAMIARQNSMQS